ncbi:isochorismatase family protein [Sphingomonas sp. Leaf4]|uniref:isochorismatase family protein n=1 Tax=Sphingomonas sp. Leaf4 TaxID=2876553 RepID=UPI001E331369|nr:isochorismatase family protein [Sphingomonas sp. Leaf4]
MRDLIVVVDTQADFMLADGALPVPGADRLAAPIRAWLGRRQAADTAAVVFTFDTHFADTYSTSAEATLFPIHCVHGTPGWRNLVGADVVAADIPCLGLEKGVFDMWAEPGLTLHDLRQPASVAVARDGFFAGLRAAGIDRAIVVGVAADYCVRWAIDGLVARGFVVEVPADLTRGIERSIDRVIETDFAGAPVVLSRDKTVASSITSPFN